MPLSKTENITNRTRTKYKEDSKSLDALKTSQRLNRTKASNFPRLALEVVLDIESLFQCIIAFLLLKVHWWYIIYFGNCQKLKRTWTIICVTYFP